ncbi:MAG: DUF3500 domain-containing protein [Bryobacterales bacterium]|nr:DUF3500 domain-containing protein [Bryobacterales bacterium]
MRFRIACLAAFAALLATAYQQSGGNLLERFRAMSRQSEDLGLAAPFQGVTARGEVEKGLYTVRSTGVSTEPVRKAAEAFLAALDGGQRARTMYKVDDPEWRKWMNQHFYVRQGVSFLEMSEAQRETGIALLRASLSAKGLKLTRDIMRLNHTLGELNNNDWEQYGEWRYHLTVMGKPSATEPWGWQLDGHHAIVNYFVMGTQVVMSPVFVGSEPVVAESGRFKGTEILRQEQDDGLKMLLALDGAQRKKAILEVSKTGNNNLGEAFKDNLVLDYAGVPARELNATQRKQLLALAGLYIANMDDGHALVKMSEVRKHLDRTYFAWIGGTDEASVYYYRIHSPVVLIEFDHQRPANLRHLARDASLPNRQHIHCVVRTPNGNDYGKDLLRQHYLAHPHTD